MADIVKHLTLSQLQDLYLLFCRHPGLSTLSDCPLGGYNRKDPVDRMFLPDWARFVEHLRLDKRLGSVVWSRTLTGACGAAAPPPMPHPPLLLPLHP